MPGVIFSSGLPAVTRFKIKRCQKSSTILKLLSINSEGLLLKVQRAGKDVLWHDLCVISCLGKCVWICLDIVQKCKSSTCYKSAFTHLNIKIPTCQFCAPVCAFAYVSICTLVCVGSVDREACSILFAQELKKHVVLARLHCDMSLLKATWPARIQPCDSNSTERFNTLFHNRVMYVEKLY